MSDSYIQRGPAEGAGYGTPIKSDNVTRRQHAQAEARELGIDPRGLSTKEIQSAVNSAKAANEDMAKFINKVMDKRFGPDNAAVKPPVQITNRQSEDAPSGAVRGDFARRGERHHGVPIKFYTWVDGKAGEVVIYCQTEPYPI